MALKAYQSDLVVRQEALYALANICNKGVDEHVKTLVEFDALRALTTFIDTSSDVSLLVEVLNAINRVLEVGETESWLEYDRYFYEYSGIERLEKLADAHQSPQIYKLAANILDRFFSSQDTLDENRAPDEISNDSTTPSDWAVKKKLQFDFNSPRTNPNARNGASGFGFQNRGL